MLNSLLKLCLDCGGKDCADVTTKAKKIFSLLPVTNGAHHDTNDQLRLDLFPQNTALVFSHICHLQQN